MSPSLVPARGEDSNQHYRDQDRSIEETYCFRENTPEPSIIIVLENCWVQIKVNLIFPLLPNGIIQVSEQSLLSQEVAIKSPKRKSGKERNHPKLRVRVFLRQHCQC